MKKQLFGYILSLILITSCTNSRVQELEHENEHLAMELLKQQFALDNSIVIPYDSISKYMMPVCFGARNTLVGESDEFRTFLAWSKLPPPIEYNWSIIQGAEQTSFKDSLELSKRVSFSYSTPGEKEIIGNYELIFPDGNTQNIIWLSYTSVAE